MIKVIVTACSAFGFTVSEAKTDILCLQNKRWGEGVVHYQCSRPGIQTNNRVCVLGRGYRRAKRTLHRNNGASSEVPERASSGTRWKSIMARVCAYG